MPRASTSRPTLEDIEIHLDEDIDGNGSYFGDENETVENFDGNSSEDL